MSRKLTWMRILRKVVPETDLDEDTEQGVPDTGMGCQQDTELDEQPCLLLARLTALSEHMYSYS